MDMEQNSEKQLRKIKLALTNKKMEEFRQLFLDEHSYNQAQFFMEQDEEERQLIYAHLSSEEVATFMRDIEDEDTKEFIMEMDTRYAANVLAEMPADDAVDILNELNKDVVASFLTIMDKQAAEEIKQLIHYEEKTAGSIMTTEFVSLEKSQTAKQAMQNIKEMAPDAETIYYMYVVDASKKLVGVLSLRELIIADEDTLIGDIMDDNTISVSVGADQEEVARMMRDYDFLALPVIDYQNHLLGIITVDDILDVMDEEASDDYSKLAAMSDVQRPDDSALIAAKKRLPWLIILLFLGMFTASLIGQFEETLEQVALLAIFIPLIAGMAGNTGTQSLAVAVRGLATGDFGKQGKFQLLLREATTGLITGAVCGTLIALIIFVWKGEIFLGILVGVAILVTLIVATLSGTVIPLAMDKMKIDPAVASGPFITTINDIISILIYFGFATAFMSYLL